MLCGEDGFYALVSDTTIGIMLVGSVLMVVGWLVGCKVHAAYGVNPMMLLVELLVEKRVIVLNFIDFLVKDNGPFPYY
jgi:hypothetical protein